MSPQRISAEQQTMQASGKERTHSTKSAKASAKASSRQSKTTRYSGGHHTPDLGNPN